MSEPILNAIIKLFALVAREGRVSKEERSHIESFLQDHVGQRSVGAHLSRFDDYCNVIAEHTPEQEAEDIKAIALEINREVAQKQKSLIMIELMSSVLTDSHITEHENNTARAIANALNISESDQDLIKYYVLGQKQGDFEHDAILSVDSSSSYSGKGRHLYRAHLDGVIAILYLASTESFFFKTKSRTKSC